MEIIVEDKNGNQYKVNTEKSNNKLICEVRRALGIGGNEYDYGEMEYEEDAFAEFEITWEEVCDIEDDERVEYYIQSLFYDNCFLEDELGLDVMDTEDEDEDVWKAPHAKKVLAEYYALDLESMPVADALSALSKVANEMAEIIESKFDYAELH